MIGIRKRWRRSGKPTTVVEAADALAKAGKRMDAIQLLTEANRRQRDRSIERRLVELRFEAFRNGTWTGGRPEWPDAVEDLFPDTLIPEIPLSELSVESVRSGIRNHGSLLVRGLVGEQAVERLKSDIDATFDAYDAEIAGETRPELDGWYERCEYNPISDRKRNRAIGALVAVDSPPTMFDLVEALDDAGMRRLADDYFGESPMMLARKVTLRRMPHNASGGWHQDGAFMGSDIRSLNIWLALSHCGVDAPSLDVVGRRFDQLVKTGVSDAKPGGGGYADWGVSPENAAEAAAGAIVRPVFAPGDALIFDQLCLHRTGKDPSMTKGRYAIETWLFSPSTYDAMTTKYDEGYSPRDQLPMIY